MSDLTKPSTLFTPPEVRIMCKSHEVQSMNHHHPIIGVLDIHNNLTFIR